MRRSRDEFSSQTRNLEILNASGSRKNKKEEAKGFEEEAASLEGHRPLHVHGERFQSQNKLTTDPNENAMGNNLLSSSPNFIVTPSTLQRHAASPIDMSRHRAGGQGMRPGGFKIQDCHGMRPGTPGLASSAHPEAGRGRQPAVGRGGHHGQPGVGAAPLVARAAPRPLPTDSYWCSHRHMHGQL